MKPMIGVVSAALLLLATPATPQTDAQAIQALNNFQHEASTCIAYYTVIQVCVEKEDDPDLVAKIEETRKFLIEFATQIGESIGMTGDAMVSRVLIEQERMQELTQRNCVNISSLLGRYAMRCKQAVENGDSIFLEYLEPR